MTHMLNGSPVKPGGHRQFARWFSLKQIAFELQGFELAHGLMQSPLSHASLFEHSWSDSQPTASGITAVKDNRWKYEPIINKKLSLLLTYFVTAFVSFSSKTWQTCARHGTERKGVVDSTLGIWGTWVNCLTGVFAFLIQAWLSAWTIPICCAFHFRYWNWGGKICF